MEQQARPPRQRVSFAQSACRERSSLASACVNNPCLFLNVIGENLSFCARNTAFFKNKRHLAANSSRSRVQVQATGFKWDRWNVVDRVQTVTAPDGAFRSPECTVWPCHAHRLAWRFAQNGTPKWCARRGHAAKTVVRAVLQGRFLMR